MNKFELPQGETYSFKKARLIGDKLSCVYVIHDIKFNPVYVGKTTNLRNRFYSHVSNSDANPDLYSFLSSNILDNITVVIYRLNEPFTSYFESELIQIHNPRFNRQNGSTLVVPFEPLRSSIFDDEFSVQPFDS